MNLRSWSAMVLGACALFIVGNAAAQQAPSAKIRGENVQILTPLETDFWKERLVAGRIGTGLTIDAQVALVGPKGMRIDEVEEGSTAEDAGLLAGDVITAVDSNSIAGRRSEDVQKSMHGESGAKTTFSVLRGSACVNVVVKHDVDGALGIRYTVVDPVVFPVVDYVWDNSPASRAGLQKGDRLLQIAGVDMDGFLPGDAAKILHDRGPLNGTVTVRVERQGQVHDVELGRAILPGWDKVLDYRSGPGYGSDAFDQYTTVTIKHLDWAAGDLSEVLEWGFSTSGYGSNAGVLLDLRGTTGWSTAAAAIVAAHVVPSGSVLRFKDDVTASDVTYKVEDGKLYKTTAYTKELVAKTNYFAGKVAVLVDENTDGVAVALAHTLQDSKRAIVVGVKTKNNASLRSLSETTVQAGKLVGALSTTGHLTNLDGTPLTAVSPDEIAVDNPGKTALMVLAGSNPWLDVETITWLLLFIAVVTFGLYQLGAFIWRRARGIKPATPEPTEQEPAPEAPKLEEKPVSDEASASKETSGKSSGGNWGVIAMLAALAFMLFGVPKVVEWFLHSPPLGGHAEVLVELFVDGSANSEQEKSVIAALQSEMHGPIKFVTIDLREHPEYKTAGGPKAPFAIDHAPFVWVYLVKIDRDGHEVSRAGSGSGSPFLLSKRKVLKDIRWQASGANREPAVPITRTYPAAK
jgi:C-terminal processing protease CtpA/Prc